MVVHDGQRRGLHVALADTLGDRLPRVACARSVQIDAVRLDAIGFVALQRAKGLNGVVELVEHARIVVRLRDAPDEVRIAAADDVRAPRSGGAPARWCALGTGLQWHAQSSLGAL